MYRACWTINIWDAYVEKMVFFCVVNWIMCLELMQWSEDIVVCHWTGLLCYYNEGHWRRYINPFSFSFTVYENFAKHELGQICLCFGELQSWLWNCLLLKLRSGSSNDGRCVSIVQTLLHDIVMECRYSWGRETFTQLTGHCKSITVVLTHSLQWRWYDHRTVKCPRLFV